MPEQQLPPIVPRALRTRVAMPMPPPVLKPSLIPHDVLQDVQREAQREKQDDSFDGEPRTAPIQVTGDFPILGTVTADLEVAYFALTQVPMFRDLPQASLEAMAEGAHQLEVPDGEFLFQEG